MHSFFMGHSRVNHSRAMVGASHNVCVSVCKIKKGGGGGGRYRLKKKKWIKKKKKG